MTKQQFKLEDIRKRLNRGDAVSNSDILFLLDLVDKASLTQARQTTVLADAWSDLFDAGTSLAKAKVSIAKAMQNG